MINRCERDNLANQLRRLLEGEISNDAFIASPPSSDDDPALLSIWSFITDYCEDVLPYRFRGMRAPSSEMTATVDRCVLFLQSDLEYEWPVFPSDGFPYYLLAVTCLVLSVIMGFGSKQWCIAMSMLALSTVLFVFFWLYRRTVQRKREQSFWSHGDRQVWPFLRQADYERRLTPGALRR
jgi:hypothetical protein